MVGTCALLATCKKCPNSNLLRKFNAERGRGFVDKSVADFIVLKALSPIFCMLISYVKPLDPSAEMVELNGTPTYNIFPKSDFKANFINPCSFGLVVVPVSL